LVDSLRSVVYLGDAPFPPVAVRGLTNGCSAPVAHMTPPKRATARPPLSPLHKTSFTLERRFSRSR
jgi:hypothetical protein